MSELYILSNIGSEVSFQTELLATHHESVKIVCNFLCVDSSI